MQDSHRARVQDRTKRARPNETAEENTDQSKAAATAHKNKVGCATKKTRKKNISVKIKPLIEFLSCLSFLRFLLYIPPLFLNAAVLASLYRSNGADFYGLNSSAFEPRRNRILISACYTLDKSRSSQWKWVIYMLLSSW